MKVHLWALGHMRNCVHSLSVTRYLWGIFLNAGITQVRDILGRSCGSDKVLFFPGMRAWLQAHTLGEEPLTFMCFH